MRHAITRVIVTLSLLGTANGAIAAEKAGVDPAATTITVWIDGKGQESMAKKVNQVHADMFAKGWRFAELEIYTENGDMQGIFATYVRDAVPVAAP